MRLANHGERQGRGDPQYTVRPFDTLRDRMQEPERPYSVRTAVLVLIVTMVVSMVWQYLAAKGIV